MTAAGTTPPQPAAAPPHEPIRALLRAGKNDEAIVRLAAIVVTRPDDLDAKELLFDAFFQKRDWLPALALAEELVRRRPDVARLQKALVATLSNLKRFDEAILRASQYIERHGEELTILDALKVAHFYTGKVDEAIRFGQRGIEIRDAEAANVPRTMTMTEPRGAPQGDNVISFSLWGPAPFYSYGAMINLVLCRSVYPGWTYRIYLDETVPKPCVAYLRDNGADVRRMEDEYPGVGLFQRFLVMNDKSVGRFLVRDCDARVSAAEADLVRRWIDGAARRPRYRATSHPESYPDRRRSRTGSTGSSHGRSYARSRWPARWCDRYRRPSPSMPPAWRRRPADRRFPGHWRLAAA
jgi:tetratricopeptide (TPR) repeat protein